MSLLQKLLRKKTKTSATTAKERLQIIISHERAQAKQNQGIMQQLQNDLLQVIAKYLKVDPAQIQEQVKVDVEQENGNSIIELNITLPDTEMLEAITD